MLRHWQKLKVALRSAKERSRAERGPAFQGVIFGPLLAHAICPSRLLPALVMALIAITSAGQPARAQQPAPPITKKENAPAARLAEMTQIARSFHAFAIEGGKRVAASMPDVPLYRWNDPTRDFSDGTLWFWKLSGRPIAVVAIELYPQNKAFGTVWALEFSSLATGPIEVEGGEHFDRRYADMYPPHADGSLRWAPSKGGITFREVPDAPAPAGTEPERLRQMKDILKPFSAHELYRTNLQDYTLRLISHPVDRYADAASGLIDGAIFAYANGTNPEVLVLLEARRQGNAGPAWKYAAAPLARAKVSLNLARQEVWAHLVKEVQGPEDTYFLARRPSQP
jgi:hypothetical protein